MALAGGQHNVDTKRAGLVQVHLQPWSCREAAAVSGLARHCAHRPRSRLPPRATQHKEGLRCGCEMVRSGPSHRLCSSLLFPHVLTSLYPESPPRRSFIHPLIHSFINPSRCVPRQGTRPVPLWFVGQYQPTKPHRPRLLNYFLKLYVCLKLL